MSLVPKDWSKELKKIELQNKAKIPQTQNQNLAQLSRPIHKTSRYYFNLYKKIWGWLFSTLPFDFLMIIALPLAGLRLLDQDSLEMLKHLLLVLAGLSLIWFLKDFIISKLALLEDLRGNIFIKLNDRPWLIFIALGFFILFEVFSKTANLNLLVGIALAGLVFFFSAKSMREQIREKVTQHQKYRQDLTQQVELFNKTVFMLHLVPLISARAIVLLVSLSMPLALSFDLHLALFLCFGCILLSLMPAEEKLFMFSCCRCGVQTSRFLSKHRQCLSCLNSST